MWLLLLLLCSCAILVAEATIGQFHLSFSGRADSIVLEFVATSDAADANLVVEYRGDNDSDNDIGSVDTNSIYRKNVGQLHSALMTNLEAKKYSYRVKNKEGDALTQWIPFDMTKFETAAVYADFGLTKDVSMDYLKQEKANGAFDYVVHVGDIAYDLFSDNSSTGNTFMGLISDGLAESTPYMVAEGNHESGDNFQEYNLRFKGTADTAGQVSGSMNNHFYSYNVGLIHYIVVSTEIYAYPDAVAKSVYPFTAEEQLAWLEHDLQVANKKENREAQPWIVMLGHKGFYMDTDVSGSDLKGNFTAFDSLGCLYGVDLFVCGHIHLYQRFLPLLGADAPKFMGKPRKVDRETTQRCVDLGITGVADSHYYCDPKFMTSLVVGSPGCHDEAPRGACALFHGLSNLHWDHAMMDCDTDYGYGHLTAVNKTHLYWDTMKTGRNNLDLESLGTLTEKLAEGFTKLKLQASGTSGVSHLFSAHETLESLRTHSKYAPYLAAMKGRPPSEVLMAGQELLLAGENRRTLLTAFMKKEEGTDANRHLRDHLWIYKSAHGPRDAAMCS